MRGIGCYSKLSKNSKKGGREKAAGVLLSGIRLCSGGGITGALGQQRKARAKRACGQCLWLDKTTKSAETMRFLLALPAPKRKKTLPVC